MLTVISPAKTLDMDTPAPNLPLTQPELLGEAELLVKKLRPMKKGELARLMGVSDKIAALNAERYQTFRTPFTPANARPALVTFKGDVYKPLELKHYTEEDFAFAQAHLRMLSGLYGVLRPLDLMQPYRLEMGTKLKNPRGEDLYDFWGERITVLLNRDLKGGALVNMASNEYWKAVKPAKLKGRIITPLFKEKRGKKVQTIALMAKKARGMMVNHIIRNQVMEPEALKKFKEGGYRFEPKLSSESEWVFVR